MTTAAFSANTGRDEFLQLLVTQLKHQDPLQPVDQENFIAQLAQFSTLEGIESLNASFEQMLQLQHLTQGVQIVGKEAVFQASKGTDPIARGTVTGVTSQRGTLYLIVNEELVSLDRVYSIGLKAT
jgi:flagellar basal-body rod modification protein FlgD